MIKHLKGLEINSIYDFDNAFSINELLCKFWEKIEEVVNISNESIDILNWIKEEGLPDEVQTLINQLVADGTIEQMINVDKIEEVKTLINAHIEEINNKIINLDNTVEKIKNNNIKFKENFLLKRNPYGTFENASSFSVVTNSDKNVQVLGISPENDSVLADYDNRDIVGIFNSITTNNSNIMIYDNCSYTVNSVKLSLDANIENLKEGMIIDTLHDTKYSAIIKSIDYDNKILYVHNWYEMGNKSKGQVPPSSKGCKINNITKIWNLNTNLVLRAEDNNTAGCGFEMDILNYQSHVDNVDGFDLVLAGTFGGNNGYTARGQGLLKWLKGFVSERCDTGFYSNDSSIGFRSILAALYGFLSNGNDVAFCSKGTKNQKALNCEVDGNVFYINNDGSLSGLGLNYVVGESGNTINPYNTPFVLFRGNISLTAPNTCPKRMIMLHNISANQCSITATMKHNGNNISGLQVPAGRSVQMYCDGSIYYVLDFNLS